VVGSRPSRRAASRVAGGLRGRGARSPHVSQWKASFVCRAPTSQMPSICWALCSPRLAAKRPQCANDASLRRYKRHRTER
jgi:hypothetical protein